MGGEAVTRFQYDPQLFGAVVALCAGQLTTGQIIDQVTADSDSWSADEVTAVISDLHATGVRETQNTM